MINILMKLCQGILLQVKKMNEKDLRKLYYGLKSDGHKVFEEKRKEYLNAVEEFYNDYLGRRGNYEVLEVEENEHNCEWGRMYEGGEE